MPAKPIEIGSLRFSKKGEAIAFFRNMLNKYELGDEVSDADTQILSLLIARHPEATEKIGPGIACFKVKSADFGTRCFWITQTNGVKVKFSFRACLD